MALSFTPDRAPDRQHCRHRRGRHSVTHEQQQYGTSGGASEPNITTGELTLNGGSVADQRNSNRQRMSASMTSSNLRGSLWLSNNRR